MTHPPVLPQYGGNISLCTGSAALDQAVEHVTGLTTVAVAEKDPAASRLLAARVPHARNLGDITAVDWKAVAGELPRPAALTAGFPCQDISNAGPRGGIAGDRSGLWKTVAEAVRVLRPRLVFLENVAAIRSRGLDVVAADLAEVGYDARWMCLRAGDAEVGACHRRDRWFAVAYPAAENPHLAARAERGAAAPGQAQGGRARAHAGGRSGLLAPTAGGQLRLFPTPSAADGTGGPGISPKRRGGMNLRTAVTLLPTPVASEAVRGSLTYPRGNPTLLGALALLPTPAARDWKSGASNLLGTNARPLNEFAVNALPGQAATPDERWVATNGTDYGPAIRRWETVLGRPAPDPTEPGTKGNRRLSPAFVEWMMGAEPGWVTGSDLGLSRPDQLKILGNGVVIHQAAHAYATLLAMLTEQPALGEAAA
ncbi:DNA cytosine methyltransferase [Streptomyces sp. SID11385]|uniref:DNA cytosine methyltransferase n=1 Tax=Streptomyces sp. SID11385 TaxID=2706031 RepID=UPI0013CC6C76|nr:DNA cytosine methyltransferase [Streptomyces sp. SID11385]NEA43510.1 DNA cytosine methyltransferase [Streptomyces sp. SID11385]